MSVTRKQVSVPVSSLNPALALVANEPSSAKARGKRLFLYGRQSTNKQGDVSPEVQRDRMQAYCNLYDHQIIAAADGDAMHFEIGSGAKNDRKVLQDLKARVLAGEADGIVVAYLDRLARNTLMFLELVKEFESAGKVLIAIDVNLDTSTPIGRCVATILMSIFQMLQEQAKEKTKDTMKHLREQGKYYAGQPPYGFRVVLAEGRTTNELEKHPDEYPVLQDIYRLEAAGMNASNIANCLNNSGIPTRKAGGQWHCKQITRILSRDEVE